MTIPIKRAASTPKMRPVILIPILQIQKARSVEPNQPDLSWLVHADHDDHVHPPEYYIQQEKDFNDAVFEVEDYGAKTVLLFDVMKGRWYR
jgi:hypothetical protein